MWIKRILISLGIVLSFIAGGYGIGSRAAATSPPPYIPRLILVGPDSTSFVIKDQSTRRTVYYYCAFLSPHNTGQPIIGTHPVQYVYVPEIQCNK